MRKLNSKVTNFKVFGKIIENFVFFRKLLVIMKIIGKFEHPFSFRSFFHHFLTLMSLFVDFCFKIILFLELFLLGVEYVMKGMAF